MWPLNAVRKMRSLSRINHSARALYFMAAVLIFLLQRAAERMQTRKPRPHSPPLVEACYSRSTAELSELKDLVRTLKDFCGDDNSSGSGSLPLKCMMDDLEVEILYFSIRKLRPNVVWEISPAHGYSTTAILMALERNGHGMLYSFDVMDSSRQNVPLRLHTRWELVLGDALYTVLSSTDIPAYPKPEFLLLDSVHSREFGEFYVNRLLPSISSTMLTHVALHDVYNPTLHGDNCSQEDSCKHQPSIEGLVVVDWLAFTHLSKACNVWTPSPFKRANSGFHSDMLIKRRTFGLGDTQGARNNVNGSNPSIFFSIGC